MAEDTYKSIKEELAQSKKKSEEEVERLARKKRCFINEQTFTGVELMVMRTLMKDHSIGGSSEPNLYYVLEEILEQREMGLELT